MAVCFAVFICARVRCPAGHDCASDMKPNVATVDGSELGLKWCGCRPAGRVVLWFNGAVVFDLKLMM